MTATCYSTRYSTSCSARPMKACSYRWAWQKDTEEARMAAAYEQTFGKEAK